MTRGRRTSRNTWLGKQRITGPTNRIAAPARCSSQKSLYGRTTIKSKHVTMIYGTNQPPDRAAFGSPTAKQFEQDQKVTDTEKAYFAHASGNRNSKGQFTGGAKRVL